MADEKTLYKHKLCSLILTDLSESVYGVNKYRHLLTRSAAQLGLAEDPGGLLLPGGQPGGLSEALVSASFSCGGMALESNFTNDMLY